MTTPKLASKNGGSQRNLLIGIAVSPWATAETFAEVQETWARVRDYNLPVAYDLKSSLTPAINELKERSLGEAGSE